jgi:maltose alpha-D-glucosyltransferase/alpha-amylase
MALGSRPDLADFASEPMLPEDLADVRSTASRLLKGALDALGNRPPKDLQALRTAMSRLERLESVLANAGKGKLGNKTRVHGDFHLGQTVKENREVWFLDFEGEPARSLAEKRRKRSPLRDVAGMLRSFHYAAHAASLKRIPGQFQTVFSETNIPVILSELFLEAYYDMLAGSDLLPQDSGCRTALLDLFVLEKAVYELHYELNNRPDWVDIPLRGLTTLANP